MYTVVLALSSLSQDGGQLKASLDDQKNKITSKTKRNKKTNKAIYIF